MRQIPLHCLLMLRRQFLTLLPAAATAAFPESFTAIQGVCAWPNLQRLPDGTLIATIFNQPCHGSWEGSLDCWASADDGKTWRFRGRPAPHEPATARMNCAAGQAASGDLVVLCSGWDKRGPAGQPTPATNGRVLRPWICRSSDGGRTWAHAGEFPDPPQTGIGSDNHYIPFGDIHRAADGALCVAAYVRKDNRRGVYFLRSRDDGRNWGGAVPLNPVGNETAPLHLGRGRWLAASREFGRPGDVHIELFDSEDDGRTWRRRFALTQPGQITGHLTRLADGRVLLSYGNRNRNNYGVDARVSDDEGKTWSPPFRLAHSPYSDSGYPASVPLPGGLVVTAYYTKLSSDFHYEMRVVRWDPREV